MPQIPIPAIAQAVDFRLNNLPPNYSHVSPFTTTTSSNNNNNNNHNYSAIDYNSSTNQQNHNNNNNMNMDSLLMPPTLSYNI